MAMPRFRTPRRATRQAPAVRAAHQSLSDPIALEAFKPAHGRLAAALRRPPSTSRRRGQKGRLRAPADAPSRRHRPREGALKKIGRFFRLHHFGSFSALLNRFGTVLGSFWTVWTPIWTIFGVKFGAIFSKHLLGVGGCILRQHGVVGFGCIGGCSPFARSGWLLQGNLG